MTAVFSYTEKSSKKLDRDSIRTYRESKKKRRLNFRDLNYFSLIRPLGSVANCVQEACETYTIKT